MKATKTDGVWKIYHKTTGKPIFEGANLTNANLTGADLTNANLTGADLTNANLTCADLRDADLTGADLTGANLRNADLRDADLDYSCLPLWCGGKFEADVRICKQLCAHVGAILEASGEAEEVQKALAEYSQGWHRQGEFGWPVKKEHDEG